MAEYLVIGYPIFAPGAGLFAWRARYAGDVGDLWPLPGLSHLARQSVDTRDAKRDTSSTFGLATIALELR